MHPLPLSGKSAVVTGGARRLGRAIALALADAGADITLTYLASADDAARTVASIQKLGRKAQAVRCDVRDEIQARAAIAATMAFHGRLDVVVNNAAVFERADLASMTVEQWDRIFATNTRGPFLVAREALPHLRASSGRIVNIGSLGGIRPWADHAHYCASKAALHMLTQTMAKAFAPEVSVNCVAPGWIAMDDIDTKTAAHFAAKTPLQRNGSADDVAQAVIYFATNSGFVTGQILAVDGGLGL
ncbi:MAG TPA: SDR family oxidoreductase [Terracidiphilus sp.]|jgi:NAD(P)-dependent dehydrogenase (short-subunit alcohol dehydrogenase family)|nr:SDR family oxidoreductase [Terracidiphilus sp.]